ncbi:MAG TPA: hypothetical protein RMH85_29590 [Polyangiaceae bacterium LLY-WYZ-15_(1-7)]|nr:hypothetical protein [Myxococcales bacterium]MAT23503.1 hypothetical protein [Sandaracinus sp.]HJL02681.1 hypothetical protein [Polyangiaceae bacterium LLY-WYZ-15_(1-7)]MBJ73229.1 hypothetical protein [Sandaracinus sp.]HJL12671.1 hypothetical protein [Polyangiaceae bacterium LLY-WYZ-15_(1-7)]
MRWLRVPSPNESVGTWHVAPWVDTLAYAFSWLPFLLPVAFLGDHQRIDYLWGYLIVLAFTDVHRHYGFPYVYMDGQVFGRHPVRFTIFPLVMLVAFAASPFLARGGYYLSPIGAAALGSAVLLLVQILLRDRGDAGRPRFSELGAAALAGGAVGLLVLGGQRAMPHAGWERVDGNWALWAGLVGASVALDLIARRRAKDRGEAGPRFVFPALALATILVPLVAWPADARSLRVRSVLNFAAVFAGAWNIWHVYMQKYGIFRMYNAKSGNEEKVPGWVDRLLIFAWLPFYLFYLGSKYRSDIDRLFSRGREALGPLLDLFAETAEVMMWPTGLLVVASLAIWVRAEHRVNGLKSRPRLVMATGTTLLAASFLLVHPLKAYLAYALSHAVEYMVFVWAFQRRRYRHTLEHRPTIARFLGRPILVYVVSAAALGVAFVYLKYYGRWIWPREAMPQVLGFTTYEWIGYWTVYQSMVHFYFDGFLWKMRLPAIRATVGA